MNSRVQISLHLLFGLAISLYLSSLPITTWASPIIFTDETSFADEVIARSLDIDREDFEASMLGNFASNQATDLGLVDVIVGNNVSNSNPPTQVSSIRGPGPGTINGSQEFTGFLVNGANLILSLNFETDVFGFAGTWASTTTGDRLTVTVNGTVIEFDNFLTGSGNGFLGVLDSNPFSNITFGREVLSTNGEFFVLDELLVATSTTVTEPATASLLILVMALFFIYRKAYGKSSTTLL